ncbi:hypothetical protein I6F66_02440 [Pseudoalteromonas sp. NZS100_1]|uniref:hypothetical protein n=1 Tax=Pseudoalteromonas sp. NZS100_1 TaxID=2792073 RepID=UPI0018CE5F46|nr:hypothetical protein [Pseudoalteromonas sp. NZS100_1]MBH0010937.1 hypothetical protein [Pseudoalteromonas sp. NZS100_1]
MNIISQENIQWIFSGCGVAIVSVIVVYIKNRKKKPVKEASSSEGSSIKSGNDSNNVISKGNVNINITGKD